MQDGEPEYKLDMAVPNGIMLMLIGLLVLLTPFTTQVPETQWAMDIVAGAVLSVGGLASLLWARLRRT